MEGEKESVQMEFIRLQREYRMLEANKKQYADESLTIIRKQKEMIQKLERDNAKLKEDLSLEMRFSKRRKPGDETQRLHDQIDLYSGKAQLEEKKVAELRDNVRKLRERVGSLRRSIGGSRAAQENERMIRKQTKILENRLEKALVKFNQALASNRQQREDIDALRRDRRVYDDIYRQMEAELEEVKAAMSRTIEESNQAYEVRDAATVQVLDLQASMARERESHEREVAELEQQVREEDQAMHDAAGAEHRGQLTQEQESKIADEQRRIDQELGGTQRRVASLEDRIARYEQAFERIQEATGIGDVQTLVRTFAKDEEANFSLFNFVAEQSAEVERIEERIATMRAEAATASAATGDSAVAHRELLRELEERLAAATAASASFATRHKSATEEMAAACVEVQRLSNLLRVADPGQEIDPRYDGVEASGVVAAEGEVDEEAASAAGGAGEGAGAGSLAAASGAGVAEGALHVTESNSMAALANVEERATLMLQGLAACRAVDKELLHPSVSGLRPGEAPADGVARGCRVVFASRTPAERHGVLEEVATVLDAGPGGVASVGATGVDDGAQPQLSGPGHGSPSKLGGTGTSYAVRAPRLQDFDDEDDDEEDDAAEHGMARPLSIAELKRSVALGESQ